MTHLFLRGFACFILAFTSVTLFGFDSKKVPEAPVPPQIINAKKVFVANGGDDFRFESLGNHRAYDQFYAALKDWNHFELVASPADADLVCEISLAGDVREYGSQPKLIPILRLKIFDPKTRTLLWSFTENLEENGLVGFRQDSKFDKAMQRLVKDLQGLLASAKST